MTTKQEQTQQITTQSLISGSTGANTAQVGSPNTGFLDTGSLSSIKWATDSKQHVQDFYDDIKVACEDYSPKPSANKWCTLIVIQDICADVIRYATLCHSKG